MSAGCRIASRPSRKKHFVILPKAGELPSVPLQTLFPSLGLPFTTRMRGGGGGAFNLQEEPHILQFQPVDFA